MKKRIARGLVVLLLLLGMGSGAWWWQNHQDSQTSHSLTLHGNVDIREVQLAFNGKDRITDMFAEEGDRVTKGQLLARFDTQRLQMAVASAEAQLKAQQAIVDRLLAGSRPEEIRRARADADEAVALLHDAMVTYRRTENLYVTEAVSRQQLDDARSAWEAAKARLRAAKESLILAKKGPRKEDIASARATLRAYRADLELKKQYLADASLYAPSDGIIEDRLLERGDMASPEHSVFTLALTDPLWIRAYISEPDLGNIHLGMNASVQTDSFPDKSYEGWIGFISPKAEFTPKSVETREVRTSLVYQVRVFVCNPQDDLRLGMPATVTIPLDQPTEIPSGDTKDHCRGSE